MKAVFLSYNQALTDRVNAILDEQGIPHEDHVSRCLTADLLERCASLRQAGFTLALDDVTALTPAVEALLPLVHIVKVVIGALPGDSLNELVTALTPYPVELLAEQVETLDKTRLGERIGEVLDDMVMEQISAMGIRDLTVNASALFDVHLPMLEQYPEAHTCIQYDQNNPALWSRMPISSCSSIGSIITIRKMPIPTWRNVLWRNSVMAPRGKLI